MTWDEALKQKIQERWRPGDVFTLDHVYEWERYFQRLYPNNRHVTDKLRQVLQNLRDAGFVEFLGNGRYRRKL